MCPQDEGGSGSPDADPAAAESRWSPDPDSPLFTLAVMPDTQFLYWSTHNSINPAPQTASFRYIIENSGSHTADNVVFMAHLGDLTQDADASSFGPAGAAFEMLDSHGVGYSVRAGNHDVTGDDTRGNTPYLRTMGPHPTDNGWMAVLGRRGPAGKAGKHGHNTDPEEPVVTLSITDNGREPQFNCYPLNQTYPATNWGQALPENTWWHLAVVNDGRHTVLYVDGAPVLNNPSTVSTGIATLGLTWLLGGREYGGAVDQIFHGWIGDVRIVNRALPTAEFMIGR